MFYSEIHLKGNKQLTAFASACLYKFRLARPKGYSQDKSGQPSSQNNYIHPSIHCLHTYQCRITRKLMDGLVPNKVASECRLFF